MSQNKITVQKYMDAFATSDRPTVLATLTDDIEWVMPGAFHLRGKAAFAKEMQNDAFGGNPIINLSRMIEEKNVVVAEGNVRSATKAGGFLNAVFCDVFEMQNGRIKRLTSYVMEIKDSQK